MNNTRLSVLGTIVWPLKRGNCSFVRVTMLSCLKEAAFPGVGTKQGFNVIVVLAVLVYRCTV